MHLLPILNVVGILLFVLGAAQLLPMGAALVLGESDWWVFLTSALGAMLFGGGLHLISRSAREISDKDGFAVVTLGWLAAAGAGAVPYQLSGATTRFTDAFFESMSGFTTTGATIFVDVSGLSSGILLWRSLTQWFGGMGIIVLALVILPTLGIGGMQLYKREVPGPTSEKITPRLRDTAKALWSVYLLITVVEWIVLWALGMSIFEALNHSLTTVSTGGFSTRTGSVGEFASPAITWVITLFMALGGMNFALHFRLLVRHGHRDAHIRNTEWRWYMGFILLASLALTFYLVVNQSLDLGDAFTHGTFQVVSILTTTGFGTADYMLWGAFPQMLLLIMMMIGGCAGSTAGGVKWVRVLLVFSFIRQGMIRLVHPKAIVHSRLGSVRVTEDIVSNILAFIFLYLAALVGVTLLLALDGLTLDTSLGAASSALGNIGPGLGAVGPAENYSALSGFSKWVLLIAMLCGRLELMTVLVLFTPVLWRK